MCSPRGAHESLFRIFRRNREPTFRNNKIASDNEQLPYFKASIEAQDYFESLIQAHYDNRKVNITHWVYYKEF